VPAYLDEAVSSNLSTAKKFKKEVINKNGFIDKDGTIFARYGGFYL
jgi:hypothetical protein